MFHNHVCHTKSKCGIRQCELCDHYYRETQTDLLLLHMLSLIDDGITEHISLIPNPLTTTRLVQLLTKVAGSPRD